MKKIFLIFMLISSVGLSAQEKTFKLLKDTIKARTYTGNIGNYPVTIHLEYAHPSGGHLNIYSVKGWYYYDKYKKKIPLVGVYDGGFTLYAFDNKKLQQKVLDFDWYTYSSFWKYIDKIKNLEGYKEKLIYTEEGVGYGYSNTVKEWTDGKKKLNFKINNIDSEILEYHESLVLPNNKQINLLKNFSDSGFELYNYVITDNNSLVLLKYSYISKPNLLGRCGAGTEAGYWLLKFDKSYQLLEQKRISLESCIVGIYYEIENIPDIYIEEYNLITNESEIDIPKKIIIDPVDITIEEEYEKN